ncbi:MAG: peptidoglycan-binding protein [Candidatus Kaiserbacteria bacterium]|nr:peptidoglycan-binding protein [Candidatus Kaiserbacteria bacterium]
MRKTLFAGAAVALAMAPAIALAQTDNSSQIQSLISQIQSLQQQLKALLASSTPKWGDASSTPMGMPPGQMGKQMCISLNRNLQVGAKGDDVKQLQQMFKDDPESDFKGAVTGFFGPLTANAMAKFQMKMGIASSTDGRVGPATRGFFERSCGKGLGGGQGEMMMDHLFIVGTVNASSATSITVQMGMGSTTKTAIINASTTIQVFNGTTTPPTAGTVADLTIGKRVMVEGTKASDGTVTATRIAVGEFPMPMNGGDDHREQHGDQHPGGMMPINGGQNTGRGLDGHGPQNW